MDAEFAPKSTASVRSSQIFYNIADEDMSDFFLDVVDEDPDKEDKYRETIIVEDSDQIVEEVELMYEDKEKDKDVVSRLDIQIEKNGLKFIGVYGEIFIMIMKVQLIGENKSELGLMLVTNYRLAFFRSKLKKVDLPFGFIDSVKLTDKTGHLSVCLKYHHFWKFKAMDLKMFQQLKIFLQLYLKYNKVRSCFAFNYAEKAPPNPNNKHPRVRQEYANICNSQNLLKVRNREYEICSTYPDEFYIPASKSLEKSLLKIASKWQERRIPIATYIYKSISKVQVGLWRSSYIAADRTDNLTDVAKYLHKIKGGLEKMIVFDTGSKSGKKCVEQFEINSICQMNYLELESPQTLKNSYNAIIQCFLGSKKGFIRDIINSRWYQLVLNNLRAAEKVKNSLIMQNCTLIKCPDGREKSAQISALVQIILNPYYRTFEGFPVLIEKQFQYLGYPFATKLGLRSQKDEQIPTFIQFLDCLSQLQYVNQMSFQFNYKYLSKLSNLMYSCLFGTFITDSHQEWVNDKVKNETVPIWKQLISDLTSNAFYQSKHGNLEVPQDLNQIRVWKEHFWYLTTPPKETYRLHPLAEDNHDYVNLSCLKVIRENQQLQSEINSQRKEMQELKEKLEGLRQKRQG